MSKDTVNIRGKAYETVASRVKRFREDHPDWAIITEIVSNDDQFIVMKANIVTNDDKLLATGFAQEKYGSTNINQTSALENCETSAIGRCLASLGYLGTEFASADEVANAINQQAEGTIVRGYAAPATDKQKYMINKLYQEAMPDGDVVDYIKGEGFDPEKLNKNQASELIKQLQGGNNA